MSLLRNWLLGGFITLWVATVVIFYFYYHPQHANLLLDHPYLNLLLVVLGLGGVGSAWSFHQMKGKSTYEPKVRGVYLVGVFLFFVLSIVFSFREVVGVTSLTPTGQALGTFFFNSLLYIGALLLMGMGMLAVGRIVQRPLGDHHFPVLTSMALGTAVTALVATLLGLSNVLYGFLLAIPVLVAVFVERKLVGETLKAWLWPPLRWTIRRSWEAAVVIVGLFLLAVYWVTGLKAFALGFDGTALYANLAQLSAQLAGLPNAEQAFGWSVVMSWGELFFGSTPISILLSHMMLVPALALLYQLLRKSLGNSIALLAIVLVGSFPMFGFQATVDEKVDLGLLFISLGALDMALRWSYEAVKEKSISWRNPAFYHLVLLGLMLGFSFSIKYTSVLLIIAIVALLWWRSGGRWLYLGWLALALGVLLVSGLYEWDGFALSDSATTNLGLAFSTVGLLILGYAWWQKKALGKLVMQQILGLGLGFVILFGPWAIKHLAENGFAFSIQNILYGQPYRYDLTPPAELLSQYNNHSPRKVGIVRDFTRLTSDQQGPGEQEGATVNQAKREEQLRYLGYEPGPLLYLSLPYDLTNNTNLPGLRHQDIGFWWLALLPLLLLGVTARHWWRDLLVGIGLLIWLGGAMYSLQMREGSTEGFFGKHYSQLNQTWQAESSFIQNWHDAFSAIGELSAMLWNTSTQVRGGGMLLLMLALLIGLVLATHHRWQHWPRSLRWLGVALLPYTVLWYLVGNGITWYGVVLWAVLPAYVLWYFKQPDQFLGTALSRFAYWCIGIVTGLQVLTNVGIALSSSQLVQESSHFANWPMIEYFSNNEIDRNETLKRFNPATAQLVNILNNDKSALIYRVNTQVTYHIEGNNQRTIEDNLLQRFSSISARLKQPALFFQVLKSKGVEYVLYDLRTSTLDRTPEGTLRQKVQQFERILLQSADLELLATDHFVEDPGGSAIRLPNGQQAKAKNGLRGKTIFPGTVALFKIK